MKSNKKLIIALAAFAAVIALMCAVYISTRPETAEGAKSFTVEVVHGDGSSKTFRYNTDAEYLGGVLLDEGLIQGETSQFGLYIITVDGEDAIYEEDGSYWALYEAASVSWEVVLKVLMWLCRSDLDVVTREEIAVALGICEDTVTSALNVLERDYQAITRSRASLRLAGGQYRTLGLRLTAAAWWNQD